MFLMQLHNRLFPIGGAPVTETVPPNLALPPLGADLGNLDVEQFFDRPLDVVLGRLAMDLEGVLVVSRGAMHTFFGDQRPQQNLMRFELQAAFRLGRCLDTCHLSANTSSLRACLYC